MIKITFEIDEKLIRDNANAAKVAEKVLANDSSATKGLLDIVSAIMLTKQIDKGKTEFVVNPDKLDDEFKELFESGLGDILAIVALYEKKEAEANVNEGRTD